jgi:regulatory protein RepA
VTAWRYLLVESDNLPIELQLSLYAKLAIPVAAIWTSGGISAHAVVLLSSRSEELFRADADFILGRLSRFGVDPSNRNPSRYGRLPGALRSIGSEAGLSGNDVGQQRLLYLNPQPNGQPIFP